MKHLLISVLTILNINSGFSQTEPFSKSEILKRIYSTQVFEDDFYATGLFPSTRSWGSLGKPVDDNNVFVTASIAFILRTIQERDSARDSRIEEILIRASGTYKNYKSRRGDVTYNFWPTIGKDLPFPNSNRLSRESFRLPDDYDDTALIELAISDSVSMNKVRKKMTDYAIRNDRRTVEQTMNTYKNYKAYEVFFVDKMEQQYDIAVMCNVLTFVFRGGYSFNPTDKETFRLIQKILEDENHLENPELVSPSYRTKPWILYHLARLISFDHAGIFDEIKEKVINDIESELLNSELEMEKVLLSTSLLRLGVAFDPQINWSQLQNEVETFTFFQFKPTQVFGMLPVMVWKSEAFNLTLILEFLSYQK